LGSLTAANWVSFDFNVAYSSRWGYSLINTLKLKKSQLTHLISAVDGGSVNAFLAAALVRVMRVAVLIPAVASASVLHSAAVGGSVVGVVRPL